MANAGEIKARLTLENNDFRRKISETREQLKQTGWSAQQVSKDMGKIQKASLAVGAAMVAGVGSSIKVAANFEQSMARVKAISGATDEEFAKLEKTARHLGATTQFSASEAAEGMQYLAMAGFEVTEIIDAMPGVLNLAAAAQVDLGTSADIVSNIMTGFGLEAQETGRAVDVLTKTMTTANTDLPQLGDAMKYVAPVASSLGFSIEETAAAIGKMSDAGIQGSQAGTTLRAALLSLANPTGQTEKAMKRLNIEVKDSNGQMKPLPELIGHISSKMEGMTDAQKTQTAAQLVGREAAAGFITLLEVGEDALRDYTTELENSAGTAQEMADIQMNTLIGAFKELQSAAEEFGIKIGNQLLPAFTSIVREGTNLVGMLNNMDSATVSAGLAFAGASTGIALMLSTMVRLGIAISGFFASLGPAGWLILGVSLLGGAIAATTAYQNEANKVSFEAADAMEEQRASLEANINEYDSLRKKTALTNEELARFIDINSEMKQTADPEVIKRLKEEQDGLQKKSGLSNQELNRLIELNELILEVVPDATVEITEQGNVLLKNTDAAKAFNAEQAEMIRLELEHQVQVAESKYEDNLKKVTKLQGEINGHKDKTIRLDHQIASKQQEINKLNDDLIAAKDAGNDREVRKIQEKIGKEEDHLKLLNNQKTAVSGKIVEKSKSLEKTKEENRKLDEGRQKLKQTILAQQGLTSEKGKEVKTIEEAIRKLNQEERELINNTSEADKLTSEFQNSLSAIQNKRSELQQAKQDVKAIESNARLMNSTLGKAVNKSITLNYKTVGDPKGYRLTEYHTGGIVGRSPLPKLHTGGLASQFANAPMHNEIDVRLLRNEMVLTEAQQANLMRMIDAGRVPDREKGTNEERPVIQNSLTINSPRELSPSEIARKQEQVLRELAMRWR